MFLDEMAKISVVRAGRSYRITLKGRLTAGDLRRLERACGDALEQKLAPLELNVDQVLSIDSAASCTSNACAHAVHASRATSMCPTSTARSTEDEVGPMTEVERLG